ncbi:hypothetical protein NDR87_14225 [Nocardia sp. CDC159]|uniref:DUF8175 domain-containing protein n=1 Tax=Nocardia pulmonis TaxID=2951408 RepID=A0A9X2E551_9NOCA|nr:MULTISPECIES: hypothetical protein [Nocardia]MCM6774419.1 hypothetical protein [Nocardia pulmonis]MCM6787515.1 hypothetical protein [Nocardia sp. CDC159]
MENKAHTPKTVRFVAICCLLVAVLSGCSADRPGSSAEAADTRAVPRNLKSVAFQGIKLPAAEEGPQRDDGIVAGGYDHSPAGAALAAIQATVRFSVADDRQYPRVGQQMLAPGPGRDSWAVARAQISISGPASDPPTILGYRIASYTPERCEVDIFARQPDSSQTRTSGVVVWTNEDWKLRLPDPPQSATVVAVTEMPTDTVTLVMR